jgi:stage IV sporulation protein B
MRKIIKSASALLLATSVILCAVIGFYYVHLPDKYYLSDNAPFRINTFFDVTAESASDNIQQVYASLEGTEKVDLKLLGIIPIKRVRAEHIERPELIPCGSPFGIKILTGGAIVTELGDVDGENGFISPARDIIKPGDIITRVNGADVTKNDDISNAVQLNADKTHIEFTRDGKQRTAEVTPVKSNRDGNLKIGVWVRDSSAGIGTMTFYNPADGTFGGLGHAVCDVDTGQILPLAAGQAVSVYISGVIKGFPGAPGELCGSFMSRVPIGTIYANTDSGVFGVMDSPPVVGENANTDTIPMAYKQEVEIGPARILTTLDGNTPREYDVLIEKIDYNDRNKVKNMVIRVTDRKLLGKTGGIVQGMSGSPIVQNGRLVGAVTHVFVSDPARGYGIFAENMYRQLAAENSCETHELAA